MTSVAWLALHYWICIDSLARVSISVVIDDQARFRGMGVFATLARVIMMVVPMSLAHTATMGVFAMTARVDVLGGFFEVARML